jgi:sugar O-acyltransferase (sialic acid O-acetyltransferase NeuD family)
MTKRLLIVGTGGYAKEVAQIVRRIDPDCDTWNPISYVAMSAAEKGNAHLFGRVDYCDDELFSENLTADCIIALGEPQVRLRAAFRYRQAPNLVFPNLIDPSVDLDRDLVSLGKGNVVHRGVLMTCGITIGDFNLFNKACVVSHDVKLGSFNTVQPAAVLLSYSRLGDQCLIGAGARVLPKVTLADRTTLGAGAVLLGDIAGAGQVFVGIPAKKLR